MTEEHAKQLIESLAKSDPQWHLFDAATRAALCIMKSHWHHFGVNRDEKGYPIIDDWANQLVDDWALIIRECFEWEK